MLTLADFLRIIDAHRKGESAIQVSRKAGLPDAAVANMRLGRQPSLERAGRIAEALGLELVVRRRGEVIDFRAMHLAVDWVSRVYPDFAMHPKLARRTALALEGAYRRYSAALDPGVTSDPAAAYAALLETAPPIQDRRSTDDSDCGTIDEGN